MIPYTCHTTFHIRDIVSDFDKLEITDEVKPRVGLVGEILVKFSPIAIMT